MRYWKRLVSVMLTVSLAAGCTPFGVSAAETRYERKIQETASENVWKNTDKEELPKETDKEDTVEKMNIIGFAELNEKQSQIKIQKKISLKALKQQMPKTLEAIAEGEDGTILIPVTWKCAGDYKNSNYFYYQFNPVWDENSYQVSKEASVPYIGVFIGMDANMKFATAQENREIIYDFMKREMGFNTAAACGVLANIQAESSFRPTASMVDTNGLVSYGLCQWNGPRFASLQSYCAQNNLDYQSVEGQLSYLKYELTHSEASACAKVKNVENSAQGAYTAGYNWARYFERCSSVYFESRANLAKNTYWPLYSTGGEERKKFKITYELEGGTNHEDNPTTYYETSGDIIFKTPERPGYIFKGWFSDSKKKTPITMISGKSMQNITIYAKWEAIHFTIRFNGNGSETGWMEDMTKLEYDCLYTLRANKYKKTGYKFVGWNTKKDGKGTSYENKEDVQNLTTKDNTVVTLYAQWKKQGYAIKYVLGGGENNDSNPSSYTVSSKTIQLKNAVRTGYTFAGWYRDKKYTKKISTIPKGSTGKLTLYAKWTPHNYSVVFNGNGATSGKMGDTMFCRYGKSYKLKASKFKRAGYTFSGWNTQKDGSGRFFKDTAKIKNLTSKDNKKVTLYAQWKKISYTISYELNGGTQNPDNPKSYYTDSDTIRLSAPSRPGYTFAGWYTESSFRNKIESIKKGTKKNYTLFAKWTANRYSILFDGNGADSGQMAAMASCEYDRQYALTPCAFQKTGCRFVGWNTLPDGSGTFYKDGAAVSNLLTENGAQIVLYAQWETAVL